MTKGLKYGALSIAASALLSTSAFAGDLYKSFDGTDYETYTGTVKASELTGELDGELVAPEQLGIYVPSDIALTTLSNPTFNYVLSDATWNLDDTKFYYIVEQNAADITDEANKVVAKYTSGNGGNTIAFGATGPQVSNDTNYVVVDADVDIAVDSNDVNVSELTGVDFADTIEFSETTAGTQTLTVKLGQGDSQTISDIATGTFLSSQQQLCAAVTTKFDQTIDPADGFMSFGGATSGACGASTAGGTEDTVVISIHAEYRDINAVDDTADYEDAAVVRLNVTPALPAGTVVSEAEATTSALDAADCTVSTDGTLVTCTTPADIYLSDFSEVGATDSLYDNFDVEDLSITLQVPGDVVIPRTTFTADLDFDFDNTLAKDYAESTDNALLTAVDAGSWEFKGTTMMAPTINANADTNQMVKLNNDSLLDARVFWTLTDDAGNTVSLIEVNAANGGAATLGAGNSAEWLASDLKAAAMAVNPSFASVGGKFRGEVLVTTETGVSGVTVMMIAGGRDRVLPLTSSTTAEAE
jgi:hypothetical protein